MMRLTGITIFLAAAALVAASQTASAAAKLGLR